jgi:hypothetical protein
MSYCPDDGGSKLKKKLFKRRMIGENLLFTFSLSCVHYHSFAWKVQSETNIFAVLYALSKYSVS